MFWIYVNQSLEIDSQYGEMRNWGKTVAATTTAVAAVTTNSTDIETRDTGVWKNTTKQILTSTTVTGVSFLSCYRRYEDLF